MFSIFRIGESVCMEHCVTSSTCCGSFLLVASRERLCSCQNSTKLRHLEKGILKGEKERKKEREREREREREKERKRDSWTERHGEREREQ